jgi:phage regulator Rha-like protein
MIIIILKIYLKKTTMKEENFMISTINIDGVEIKTEISSREIAKLSNKEHKHVLRDIKILIEALKTGATQNKISIEKQEEINRLKFEPSYETQQELGKSKTGPSSETQQTRDIFEINGFEFKKSTYLTSQNKKQVEIILNKQAAILLATGYDHNLRSTIITRINELEKQLFEKANPYLNLSKLD